MVYRPQITARPDTVTYCVTPSSPGRIPAVALCEKAAGPDAPGAMRMLCQIPQARGGVQTGFGKRWNASWGLMVSIATTPGPTMESGLTSSTCSYGVELTEPRLSASRNASLPSWRG